MSNPLLDPLLHLADSLLHYDSILIRADAWTLTFLYREISVEDMEVLTSCGKVRFFAPTSKRWGAPYLPATIRKPSQRYFAELHACLKPVPLASPISAIIDQIQVSFVPVQRFNRKATETLFENLYQSLETSFYDLPTPRGQELYHDVGFRHGIGRILDVWSTGTLATTLDQEIVRYMDFCKLRSNLQKAPNCEPRFADQLHSLNGLPTLRTAILRGDLDVKKTIRLVTSGEAERLREWLKKYAEPGVDVRANFVQTLDKLPSKSSWTNWLRFGSTTTLSTALSYYLTGDPILSTSAGAAVGAADVAFGRATVAALLDPYHPSHWLGYFNNTISVQGG